MVLATPSLPSASHFKRYWGLDKCGAVFWSIDDLPACFCIMYVYGTLSLFRTLLRRLRGCDVALASPLNMLNLESSLTGLGHGPKFEHERRLGSKLLYCCLL